MDTNELSFAKSNTSLVIHPDGRLEPVRATLDWQKQRRPLEPQRIADWIGTWKPEIVPLTSLQPGAGLAWNTLAGLRYPINGVASRLAGFPIFGAALFVHPEDILPD